MVDTIDGAKHWFTARQGSRLAWYCDGIVPMGIIEAHPDHPPIIHWLDGRSEELKVTPEGTPIVTYAAPDCKITVSVGSQAFAQMTSTTSEAIETGHILAGDASDTPER